MGRPAPGTFLIAESEPKFRETVAALFRLRGYDVPSRGRYLDGPADPALL